MFLPIDTVAVILYLSFASISSGGMLRPAAPSALPTPLESLLVVGVACVTVLAGAFLLSLLLRAYLLRGALGPHPRRVAAVLEIAGRLGLVAFFLATMELSAWPAVAARWFVGAESSVVFNLAGFAVFVGMSLLAWAPAYRVHVLTAPGEWSFGDFLLHRVRSSFFLVGMWLPLIFLTPWLERLEGGEAGATPWPLWTRLLALYGVTLTLVWLMPLFLRFFWGCRRLPEGPLRQRIHELEAKAGTRFSGIFLWSLGGESLINAAAVGLLPPFRYLFLSRGLLKHLDAEEVDGVVCHELGHIHHRHLLFYLLLAAAMMPLIEVLLGQPGHPLLHWTLVVAGIAFYIRFVFAWFSRRFERQADLFALETLGSARPICKGLERIGRMLGHVRSVYSWHHDSIAQRVAFLQAAERRPPLARAHHLHVRLYTALAGILAAGLVLTRIGWGGAASLEGEPRGDARGGGRDVAHGRTLSPADDPLPASAMPLIQSARAALARGDLVLARRLARMALGRAREEATRARAAALLERIRDAMDPKAASPTESGNDRDTGQAGEVEDKGSEAGGEA